MKIHHLHDWDVTPQEAIEIQLKLADQLIDQPLLLENIHTVAGVDVSVKDNISTAAVVVMSFPALEILEIQTAAIPTPFPYIPGLLTFREGPALEIAFGKLATTPDVFIFDGMGRIHPRRIGIAAHLGLWLDRPTIGCGKTHFIGDYVMPADEKGSYSALSNRFEIIGAVLRTRSGVKPVYVSPGHRCDIDSSIEIVLHCTTHYRLPEPIRAAHKSAGRV
jgi:deoxyribonuclease V